MLMFRACSGQMGVAVGSAGNALWPGTIGTPLPKLWVKYEKTKRGLGAVRAMRAVRLSTATASRTQFFMSVE